MEENHLNLEGDAVPREDDVGDNEPGVRDPEQGLDNHSFPPVFDELRRVFLRNQPGHRLPPPNPSLRGLPRSHSMLDRGQATSSSGRAQPQDAMVMTCFYLKSPPDACHAPVVPFLSKQMC